MGTSLKSILSSFILQRTNRTTPLPWTDKGGAAKCCTCAQTTAFSFWRPSSWNVCQVLSSSGSFVMRVGMINSWNIRTYISSALSVLLPLASLFLTTSIWLYESKATPSHVFCHWSNISLRGVPQWSKGIPVDLNLEQLVRMNLAWVKGKTETPSTAKASSNSLLSERLQCFSVLCWHKFCIYVFCKTIHTILYPSEGVFLQWCWCLHWFGLQRSLVTICSLAGSTSCVRKLNGHCAAVTWQSVSVLHQSGTEDCMHWKDGNERTAKHKEEVINRWKQHFDSERQMEDVVQVFTILLSWRQTEEDIRRGQ